MGSEFDKVKKKVLLFGKTGDGKSTIANMLVSGGLENPLLFKIGSGMEGVTSKCQKRSGQGYEVVDTVGLGEDSDDGLTDVKQALVRWLVKTKGEYSHILFVKKATRRDQLDNAIWEIFCEIFKTAEPTFALVLTSCEDPDWLEQNRAAVKDAYEECGDRIICVNFPCINRSNRQLEADFNKPERERSLKTLKDSLNAMFVQNSGKFYPLQYAELDQEGLEKAAENYLLFILRTIRKYFSKGKNFIRQLTTALNFLFGKVIGEVTAAIFKDD